MQEKNPKTEQFIALLTSAQCELYSYLAVLLGNTEDAKDVLQETNVELWRHVGEYDFARSFHVWAKSFAFWKAKAFRKQRLRENKKIAFGEEIFDNIATEMEKEEEGGDGRLEALEHCIKRLSAGQSELLSACYSENLAPFQLTKRFGGSANSISARLYRIRKQLASCILKRICEIGRER